MYKKIIVTIDLNQVEKGKAIIARAANLIDQDGEVILLNVVEDLPNYLAIDVPAELLQRNHDEAEVALKDLMKQFSRVDRIVVRQGLAAREILAYADENSADLIMVASHRPDVTNYFIGATADRVVRYANCSVLIER